MTGQNPNVFYELGIRHALSNRTILVSQSLDDIPSDLREYRTIIYDTTAKGSALFSQQLKKFFDEIEKDPEQPDNPVRANLPEISDKRIEEYELTIKNLKEELTNTLQGKKTKIKLLKPNNLLKRINRIITLKNAVQQYKSVLREDTFTEIQDGKKIGYKIPVEQNHFKLFFVIDKGSSISEFWYLNQYISIENYKDELSDIRILLEKCSKKQPCNPKFILATEDNLGDIRSEIMNSFNKMLNFIDENERKKFSLEIWDEKGLISFEKELGIIV